MRSHKNIKSHPEISLINCIFGNMREKMKRTHCNILIYCNMLNVK